MKSAVIASWVLTVLSLVSARLGQPGATVVFACAALAALGLGLVFGGRA